MSMVTFSPNTKMDHSCNWRCCWSCKHVEKEISVVYPSQPTPTESSVATPYVLPPVSVLSASPPSPMISGVIHAKDVALANQRRVEMVHTDFYEHRDVVLIQGN